MRFYLTIEDKPGNLPPVARMQRLIHAAKSLGLLVVDATARDDGGRNAYPDLKLPAEHHPKDRPRW